MNIILLGPPGAGKGTQSKTLAKRLNLPHISTGDLLRQNVAADTDLGRQAKGYMNKGELVPDELVAGMLDNRFSQADIKNGFILDGYPRNQAQAQNLDKILKNKEAQIDFVIYLDTSVPVIIQRLSGRLVCKQCGANFHKTNMPPKVALKCDHCSGVLYQRCDDKEETIHNRLEVYRKEVASLIGYYEKASRLYRLAADEEAGIVLDKIVDLITTKTRGA